MSDGNPASAGRPKWLRIKLSTFLVLAAVCPLLIWVGVRAVWRPVQYRSWAEIRESHMGFEVVREPAGPGPFVSLGGIAAPRGAGISGSFHGNGVSVPCYVAADPDAEFRAVGLAPKDGSPPTYAVLRRSAP